MRCDCGTRCDLINTKVIVDSVEKEYFCINCRKGIFVTKTRDGMRVAKDRSGITLYTWKV